MDPIMVRYAIDKRQRQQGHRGRGRGLGASTPGSVVGKSRQGTEPAEPAHSVCQLSPDNQTPERIYAIELVY